MLWIYLVEHSCSICLETIDMEGRKGYNTFNDRFRINKMNIKISEGIMEERAGIEYIHEPLWEYKNRFKDKHKENVEEYFNDLVEKSQVNVEENKETVKQIRQLKSDLDNLRTRISKFGLLQALLILLIIVCAAVSVIGIANIIQGFFETANILMASIGVPVFCLALLVLIKILHPKMKELKKSESEIRQKLDQWMKTAWKQMEPLNQLFEEGIGFELFQRTVPLIKFDKVFDSRRLDYFIKRYGLNVRDDKNVSKLYVHSGEISGNPFYIAHDLVHRMGTKTYTGSITISWTTSSYENGKWVTKTHSQVLTASLEKPCPYYFENKYLVYGNEAAPDLVFRRYETDAENLTEKQINRKVERTIRKLNKKAEKSVRTGGNYTVLGNSEFEVLFGATDRNNEVQFRLLFTPLAQKQLLELMKEKEYGYGDEFNFLKERKINFIYPKHLQGFNIDVKPSYFHSFDFEEIHRKFTEYNNEFFRQIYFTFAPLLAIPLYQQHKPQEFIYQDLYDSFASFYEHENVVNRMNATEFIHPLSQTRNILKTRILKSEANCDTIKVTSYGYRTEPRVDYVSKMGGDGMMHSIPVHWVEYIPVEKETEVAIHFLNEEKKETSADKIRKIFADLRERNVKDEDVFKIGSFIVSIINKGK